MQNPFHLICNLLQHLQPPNAPLTVANIQVFAFHGLPLPLAHCNHYIDSMALVSSKFDFTINENEHTNTAAHANIVVVSVVVRSSKPFTSVERWPRANTTYGVAKLELVWT